MRGLIVAAMLVLVALAGCADSAAPGAAGEDEFKDVEVEVDDQTGAIRGVVVDTSIVPVPDALVVLTVDANDVREATSDEEGRFTFSKVPPGTFFLKVTKPVHEEVQTSVTVEAGVKEPPVIKVQLPRLFQGDPFVQFEDHRGFFTCSQGRFPGYLYSSSPCHAQGAVDLDDYGVELEQERTFHTDVQEGWQTLIFEMTWEPSAQGTSERMGMVVSTYKPERDTSHWFANQDSASPMRFQIDVGEVHPSAASTAPEAIPPEGMEQVSYFMSVRPPEEAVCPLWCVPPGFALEQEFHTYLNHFYYAPAPEGWSLVAGDEDPF